MAASKPGCVSTCRPAILANDGASGVCSELAGWSPAFGASRFSTFSGLLISMAISSKNKELFKSRAKELQDAGFADFDLRRNPSNYEKRKARELYNKLKPVLQHPEEYTIKTVSKSTANKIDAVKAKIKTKSGKVKMIIPNDGGTVRLNRDKTLTKISKDGAITKKVYKGGRDIFKTAEKLFKKIDDSDPFAKTYIMVTIGGNAPFERIFRNLAELQFYLNAWQPKDAEEEDEDEEGDLKGQLIRRMNLVTVKHPAGWFKELGDNSNVKKKGSRKNRSH